MTKKDLIAKLQTIYDDLDNFEHEETLSSAVKSLAKIKDRVGDIGETLENEVLEQDNDIIEKEDDDK